MIKRFKKIITLLSILYCVICAQASCVDKNYENDLNPKLGSVCKLGDLTILCIKFSHSEEEESDIVIIIKSIN